MDGPDDDRRGRLLSDGGQHGRGAPPALRRDFPLVEVDATYYALPAASMAELWVERTPPDFTFDIKAHALMTGQGTETKRLPKAIRERAPRAGREQDPDLRQGPAARAARRGLAAFRDGLEPLAAAGQLGSILLQYPRWFFPSSENRATIEDAVERLDGLGGRGRVPQRVVAQREERRAHPALPARSQDRVRDGRRAAGLQEQRAAGRRGDLATSRSSASTAGMRETWEAKGITPAERFRYLYTRDELARLGPADPRCRHARPRHPRPDEQLLRQLRDDQRPRAGRAPRGRAGGLTA